MGLLDEGSEIVIMREDLCEELELKVNKKRKMTMQTANGGKEELRGCVEYLELEVGGVKTYAHAFVVQSPPYRLLLGRPWQKGVKLGKIEHVDGSVEVEILDPGVEGKQVMVPTRERVRERLKSGMLVMTNGSEGKWEIQGGEDTLTEAILSLSFAYNSITQCLAYKRVVDKV